jgi:hypothetical protein
VQHGNVNGEAARARRGVPPSLLLHLVQARAQLLLLLLLLGLRSVSGSQRRVRCLLHPRGRG